MPLILIETTTEFEETIRRNKFTCNTIDMGTNYCHKQPMFNNIGCWVKDIFTVFLFVLCILCVHLIFFIFR